jgi:pheromone shutdown protein TraB
MKLRLLSAITICALLALPAARAQDQKDDQTELGAKMEKASGAWRAAKKQASDSSKNEDTLKKLEVVKDNLTAALKFEPEKTADLPADERAKFVADFRDRLKDEIARVDKVIAAVKAGDNDGVAALIAEVDKGQKEGHNDFKKKKKKKG